MLRQACAALALCMTLLAGCSSPDQAPTPEGSRYPQAQDTAPVRAIGPGDVTDAVPRADPILAVGNKSPYTVNGVEYAILENPRNYKQQGTASWYGTKFHGHKTSNGEIYDLYQASAAHKTLPIPCYARVTNLDNGRSVVVRVNDRGPFHNDRLIDLSYAAAVKLGYMQQGTARVEVEVLNIAGVDDRRGTTNGAYRFLQMGAFGSEDSARRLQGELQALLATEVSISPVESGGAMLYRVRVGPVADNNELLAVQEKLQQSGYSVGQPLP